MSAVIELVDAALSLSVVKVSRLAGQSLLFVLIGCLNLFQLFCLSPCDHRHLTPLVSRLFSFFFENELLSSFDGGIRRLHCPFSGFDGG